MISILNLGLKIISDHVWAEPLGLSCFLPDHAEVFCASLGISSSWRSSGESVSRRCLSLFSTAYGSLERRTPRCRLVLFLWCFVSSSSDSFGLCGGLLGKLRDPHDSLVVGVCQRWRLRLLRVLPHISFSLL